MNSGAGSHHGFSSSRAECRVVLNAKRTGIQVSYSRVAVGSSQDELASTGLGDGLGTATLADVAGNFQDTTHRRCEVVGKGDRRGNGVFLETRFIDLGTIAVVVQCQKRSATCVKRETVRVVLVADIEDTRRAGRCVNRDCTGVARDVVGQ